MNVVKMQDTLKDLSDRQLMQTMQTGSAPQYLVLAEMQRRKKARDSAKQQSQRQPERSVAEDIISGIAAVPTGPMQMAEGGLVSFAKGGKTGRMKGEEEACYTDSRTGEKYCPPSRPQMEMPRTGQRKTFNNGGEVGSREQRLREILPYAQQVASQLNVPLEGILGQWALESGWGEATPGNNPFGIKARPGEGQYLQTTEYADGRLSPATERFREYGSAEEAFNDYAQVLGLDRYSGARGGDLAAFANALQEGGYATDPEYAQKLIETGTSPAIQQMLAAQSAAQASPAVDTREGAVEALPEGGNTEEPGLFRRGINWLEENVGPVLEDIAPGEGVLQRDPTESADIIRVRGEEGEYETLGERAQRVAAEEQTAAAEETARREEEAARENVYAEPTPEPMAETEPETDTATEEDGLMQLVRELREERAGIQEGARERALNEALIRGGLAMAASDRPDFLAAAAEGGIGGLAGYQSAMERAAERQGEISADVSDLLIAREANDLRRQAAAASAYDANIRAQQGQINNIIDMLEIEQKSLNEGLGVMSEEEQLATQQRIDALRAQLNALTGIGQSTGGAGENILGYGEDALVEAP